MFILSLLIFIIIGVGVGFLGGLLGIGGGVIVVPSLLATFYFLGVPSEYAMHVVAGTSLAAMVFTSSSSAWAHYKQNGVNWTVLLYLAPGMILGAFLGSFMAHLFPSEKLYLIFALFLCCMGIYHLLPSKLLDPEKIFNPFSAVITLIGLAIGALSSFFGIGGGIITVPILTAMGLPIRNAISTSAVTGFIVALVGAVTFAYLGRHVVTMSGTIGYLYLPAFLCIGICSSIAAPLGAKYAYIFPPFLLNYIFGTFLLIIGLTMIALKTYSSLAQ